MDAVALVEYRFRAVMEVLAGSPVGEVAARHGTSRQSLHAWRRRFEQEGRAGLADRSRRPHQSPKRLCADVEALICELRRQFPLWGARRISYELARQSAVEAVSRATVHRVLSRNGLVHAQAQEHKRVYRRWQREAPMHLWQMDLCGGVPLADGREAKLLTGIDDHSRFVVCATVIVIPSGRAVCEAFTAAMHRYGAPFEVLTDNGKQFTGRHNKPLPVEVMFEKLLRDNGITHRLTKPRSPTTTGKIERWHKTLREEFLNYVAPFESVAVAQAAIDEWVAGYNHQRPHQALNMATPASRFRPNGATRTDPTSAAASTSTATATVNALPISAPEPAPAAPGLAVQFDTLVPPSGEITLLQGKQRISLKQGLAGRTVTIRADVDTVHILLDGHLVRSMRSRLLPQDLHHLMMRGAQPAGPEPATLPRTRGKPVRGQPVEIRRRVHRDGHILLNGNHFHLGAAHAGRDMTLRLDGHLLHAIAEDALIGTWPCPIPLDELPGLHGAQPARTPVPAPALPTGSIQVQRRVSTNGRITVDNQPLKLGARHAGKTVIVIIGDTHFRVLHGEEEIAVKARRRTDPSPDSTSKAKAPRSPEVKHLSTTDGQTCQEAIQRQGLRICRWFRCQRAERTLGLKAGHCDMIGGPNQDRRKRQIGEKNSPTTR